MTEFNSLYVAMKSGLPDDKMLPCMQHRPHCSNLDKDCTSCDYFRPLSAVVLLNFKVRSPLDSESIAIARLTVIIGCALN